MNKNEKEQILQKIASVEQTIMILKHQESNLLDVIVQHNFEHHEKEIKIGHRKYSLVANIS